MIPKIIHYYWFGGNPKPEIIEKCIASWRKYCPDYEIKEWNESNWDVSKYPYTQKAYEEKKWAFVSDVARLDVLLCGGVYLDTDVEILSNNPFEKYLNHNHILAFETERGVNTALIFGSEANSEFVQKLLNEYQKAEAIGNYKTNVNMNMPIIRSIFHDLRMNGLSQEVNGAYFIGLDEYAKVMKHYGAGTWLTGPKHVLHPEKHLWLKKRLRNPKRFEKLEKSKLGRKLVPLYTFISYDLLDMGIFYFIKSKFHKKTK